MGILSGYGAAPARTARTGRQESVGKPHPFAGKPVDMGRFYDLAAIASEIIPAHVIPDDQHNVGFVRSRTPPDLHDDNQIKLKNETYQFSHIIT